jgi:hypothetical protein
MPRSRRGTGRQRLTRRQIEQLATTHVAELYGARAEHVREVPNPFDQAQAEKDRCQAWAAAETLGDKLVPGWLMRYVECQRDGIVTESNRQLNRLAELVGDTLNNHRFETRLAVQLMLRGVPEAGLPGLTLAQAIRLLESREADDRLSAWGKWRVGPGEAYYGGRKLSGLAKRHHLILAELVKAKGRTVLLDTLGNLFPNVEVKTNAIRNYISAIRKAVRVVASNLQADPIEDMDGQGYRLLNE